MVAIDNGTIRIRAEKLAGAVYLQMDVRDPSGEWICLVADGMVAPENQYTAESALVCPDPLIEWKSSGRGARLQSACGVFRAAVADENGEALRLRGRVGCQALEMGLHLEGANHVRVQVTDRIANAEPGLRIGRLLTNLFFVPHGRASRSVEPLELAWMPNLHRTEDGVCGDHFFRSPALIVYSDGFYAVLVPDLELFTAAGSLPHALELRVFDTGPIEAPRLSYGICTYTVDGHIYTRHPAGLTAPLPHAEVSYGFDLFLGRGVTRQAAARTATAFLWERYGRRFFADIRPQVLPFEEYGRRYSYAHELRDSVRQVTLGGKKCCGIDNAFRRGANFHAWENDLNTAFGVKYYARKWQRPDLAETADGILQLLLQAPLRSGAFPCVYNFADGRFEGTLYWTARAADFLNGYDNAAMGVTAWWLLYWHEHFGVPDLSFARAYGEFLRTSQMASGACPTYFLADLTPARQLRESATTAICGAVLAKLARLTGDAGLRKAALASGRFVRERIIPDLIFNDFETYYSCSPKPLHAIDPWSGIRPHCNLSVQWACDQMLALYLLTRDREWLSEGEYLLSILSLYQQVWKPSHRSGYLYGGFGVMNTDGEWNDGRQARFVPTFADYYLATGKTEYLERAVAACRAAFALMDMRENHANGINDVVMGKGLQVGKEVAGGCAQPGMGYAGENIHHSGRDDSASLWTGMNWSSGGGLAASAYLERMFGSVWVDCAARRVTPIDGVTVASCDWRDGALALEVRSALATLTYPYSERRQISVRFGGVPGPGLAVRINGRDCGCPDGPALTNGLELEL